MDFSRYFTATVEAIDQQLVSIVVAFQNSWRLPFSSAATVQAKKLRVPKPYYYSACIYHDRRSIASSKQVCLLPWSCSASCPEHCQIAIKGSFRRWWWFVIAKRKHIQVNEVKRLVDDLQTPFPLMCHGKAGTRWGPSCRGGSRVSCDGRDRCSNMIKPGHVGIVSGRLGLVVVVVIAGSHGSDGFGVLSTTEKNNKMRWEVRFRLSGIEKLWDFFQRTHFQPAVNLELSINLWS